MSSNPPSPAPSQASLIAKLREAEDNIPLYASTDYDNYDLYIKRLLREAADALAASAPEGRAPEQEQLCDIWVMGQFNLAHRGTGTSFDQSPKTVPCHHRRRSYPCGLFKERHRVTIALGMLATDGVVIATDTQITTEGYLKDTQSKILAAAWDERGSVRHGGALFSGAAESVGHLFTLNGRLANAYLNHRAEASLQQVYPVLQQTLSDFYAEHVTPFLAMPRPPHLNLVMAFERESGPGKFEKGLCFSDLNAIRMRPPLGAVGIGGMFAEILLNRYYDWSMDVDAVKLLAAYVVFLTKESVDGCGKWTEVVAFKNGRLDVRWPYEAIEEIERIFRKYMSAEAVALDYFIMEPGKLLPGDRTTRPLSGYIKKLQGELQRVVQKINREAGRSVPLSTTHDPKAPPPSQG